MVDSQSPPVVLSAVPLHKNLKKHGSSGPEIVGRYRLTKTLGQGSYGRVKCKLIIIGRKVQVSVDFLSFPDIIIQDSSLIAIYSGH